MSVGHSQHRNTRWTEVTLAAATLLASLGVSIATVALPSLAETYSATSSLVQWVVLSYLLSVTVVTMITAALSDRAGHRLVFLMGVGIYSGGAAICAAAPTIGILIAGRAIQGIGGAVLLALPMALMRETVPAARTGSAMGLLATMSAVGTALGPSLGGLLISAAGWRASFVLLAIAGIATFALSARTLKEAPVRTQGRGPAFDLVGAALLTLALMAASLLLTGALGPVVHPGLLAALAGLAGLAFVVAARMRAAPLVPLSAFGGRLAPLAANLLVATVMMSILVVGPFFLTFSLGLPYWAVGLVTAVGPAAAAVSGVPAGRLADRFGPRRIVIAGLIQMTSALVCLAILPRHLGAAGYVLSLVALTPSFQLFLAASSTSVLLGAPEGQRATVSGLLGLTRNVGFMAGASVMGEVFTLATGTRELLKASPAEVGTGFSATFLLAACLTALSLVLAARAEWPQASAAPR